MYHTTTQPHNCRKFINLFILFLIFVLTNCTKINQEEEKQDEIEATSSYTTEGSCDLNQTVCEDFVFQEQSNDDTVSSPTILGGVYNNPYSISNMTASYNYIYTRNISSVNTTHYYIKIKPRNIEELGIIDSIDIELFDYPLNRVVVQDGDYWPEAGQGLAQKEYPWFYSVIEKNFQMPAGIHWKILEPLHIPDDNAVLEDEAFHRTGNSECDSNDYIALRQERKEYYQRIPPPDDCQMGVLDNCTGGGGGGGIPPSNPKPTGMINFATYLTSASSRIGASAPLKFIRVVGRRFFKIDKTYTDANGNFQFSKRFPRKVTIIVKFKGSVAHGQHSVRTNFINVGFWRSMFPLKKNIGTYRGNNLQNLNYEFQKGSSSSKKKTRQWLAAVIMNTTEESRLFLAENNMVSLPNDLRIYLYAPEEQLSLPQFDFLRRSNTPFLNQDRFLFKDIWDFTFSSLIAGATITVVAAANLIAPLIGGIGLLGAANVFASIPHRPDIYFFYKTSDINSITASKVTLSIGQQIGASYLSKLMDNNNPGEGRQSYMLSRQYSLENYSFDNYAPFGNGQINSNPKYKPGVVAIWECFNQHLGHILTDRIYGTSASNFQLQGKTWTSDINKSSSLKYLEEFDPGVGAPADYFNWIPVGIINDLIDNTPDPAPISPVIDNVSGFTYFEIQIALNNKPATMLEFRNHLKNIKPSQAAQIDALFSSYGY